MDNFVVISDLGVPIDENYLKINDVKLISPILNVTNKNGDVFNYDYLSLSADKLYKIIAKAKEYEIIPALESTYRKAILSNLKKDKNVLIITYSNRLTKINDTLFKIEEKFRHEFPHLKIKIVDSLKISYGINNLIYKAVKYRKDGLDIDEVTLKLNEDKFEFMEFIFPLSFETLKKMRKVSSFKSFISNVLSKKRIFILSKSGNLIVSDRLIGRKNALKKFADLINRYRIGEEKINIYIYHADAFSEIIDELKNILYEKCSINEIYVNNLDLLTTSIFGIGTIEICFEGNLRNKN